MSGRDDERDLLAAEDAALVQRIADAYAPAPLSPARRAAFDAELEARLARDRWRFAPWGLAAVAAGAAALLVLARLPAPREITLAPADESAEEEFVLSLANGSPDEFVSSLPNDYQAIASLLELE